jgi:hypothetical protein
MSLTVTKPCEGVTESFFQFFFYTGGIKKELKCIKKVLRTVSEWVRAIHSRKFFLDEEYGRMTRKDKDSRSFSSSDYATLAQFNSFSESALGCQGPRKELERSGPGHDSGELESESERAGISASLFGTFDI